MPVDYDDRTQSALERTYMHRDKGDECMCKKCQCDPKKKLDKKERK